MRDRPSAAGAGTQITDSTVLHSEQPFREATIHLDALAANTQAVMARMAAEVPSAEVYADLGADAFGHGALGCVASIIGAGVTGIVVWSLDEAVTLRLAGISSPIMSILHGSDESFSAAADHRIAVAVRSLTELSDAIGAGCTSIALVADSGTGLPGLDDPGLVAAIGELAEFPLIEARILSGTQLTALPEPALIGAEEGRSTGTVSRAQSAITIVGEELFGLSADHPSRAVMTLWAPVVGVKASVAGEGISYGYTYRTSVAGSLALVSLGYGDGIDRAAGNVAPVVIGMRRYTISGRMAMDAHVVDLGDSAPPTIGDCAVLWGDSARGHPGIADWALALEMTSAEVSTRLSNRVRRSHR